jgi:RNA polymerase sigma factor (sigma-70 family)
MAISALLEAYREYEWELLRFLGRRLGSPSLASDAVQDLYLKLHAAGDQPEVQDCRAYLFSMAANLATDRLRVERRRSEILAEVDDLVWRKTDELTPERHALARAELRHLEGAIAQLPERCRRVFYLYRFEGRSQVEIAETLGLGVTTVYKDLKTAMDRLLKARRAFRDQEPGGHR